MACGGCRMAMGQSQMMELALREVAQNFFNEGNSIANATEGAKSRITQLVHGSEDVKKHLGSIGWQEGLVVAGIAGLTYAYSAGAEQLNNLGRQRLDFDKELAAGNATFLIPSNVEKTKLKIEQGGMVAYLELAKSQGDLFPYMGLKQTQLKKNSIKVEGSLLSCLPFYEMSRQLPESLSTDSPSEKIRQSISRFFRTQMKLYLKDIKNDFNHDSKFADFFRSAWQGDNFLNNYRGPRLIIMSLGNLLWNLQHPIDSQTKFPLTLKEKIELCAKARSFINDLLKRSDKGDKKTTQFYLDALDPSGELSNFVRMIEIYTVELQEAYVEEKNNSLNLEEVLTHAHRAARTLNQNIFRIIYKKENQAEGLASYINYLYFLLKRDPLILSILTFFESTSHGFKNKTPTTLIDLLLVFCQLNKEDMAKFISKLNYTESNVRKSFALTLDGLNKKFIRPLYQAEKNELISDKYGKAKDYIYNKMKISMDSEIKSEASQRAFYQSLSLISMAVNDYNVELDSKVTKLASERNKLEGKIFYTSRQQINKITQQSFANEKRNKDDFGCDVSSYIFLYDIVEAKLNKLASQQYKIGQYTHLIATLKSFTNKYRAYLLEPKFKRFLIRALEKINDEFNDLEQLCFELKDEITFVTTDDRELIGIITNMGDKLTSEISLFKAEVNSSKTKLLSDTFEDNIKKEIYSNISKIDQRFSDAFGEDAPERQDLQDLMVDLNHDHDKNSETYSQNSDFIDSDNESEIVEEPYECVSSYQLLKVSNLIFQCYQGLSFASKEGIKGAQLLTLHELFTNKRVYTSEFLKNTVLELSQIVCAYRPSFFFQAEYAQTKSSRVLINTLIESIDDDELPLYTWLFSDDNSEIEVGLVNEKSLIRKLSIVKNEKVWPDSTDQFIDAPLLSF